MHILRTKKILFCFIYSLLMLIMMFVTIRTKIATKWYITCLYLKKSIFCHLAHGPLWERAWNGVSSHRKHGTFFVGGLDTLGKLRAKYQFYYIFSHKPWFSAFSTWTIMVIFIISVFMLKHFFWKCDSLFN